MANRQFASWGLDGSVELIQVCADASADTTADREFRALAAAGTMFPSATRRLLTLDRRGLPARTLVDVKAQPAYEWTLSPPSGPDLERRTADR